MNKKLRRIAEPHLYREVTVNFQEEPWYTAVSVEPGEVPTGTTKAPLASRIGGVNKHTVDLLLVLPENYSRKALLRLQRFLDLLAPKKLEKLYLRGASLDDRTNVLLEPLLRSRNIMERITTLNLPALTESASRMMYSEESAASDVINCLVEMKYCCTGLGRTRNVEVSAGGRIAYWPDLQHAPVVDNPPAAGTPVRYLDSFLAMTGNPTAFDKLVMIAKADEEYAPWPVAFEQLRPVQMLLSWRLTNAIRVGFLRLGYIDFGSFASGAALQTIDWSAVWRLRLERCVAIDVLLDCLMNSSRGVPLTDLTIFGENSEEHILECLLEFFFVFTSLQKVSIFGRRDWWKIIKKLKKQRKLEWLRIQFGDDDLEG